MITNVNLAAPIGALALLGTGFLIFVAAVVLIQSLVVRKRRRARTMVMVICAIAALYGSAVLIFSVTSHYKLLARGQEKHFCEIDCHLAYSILNVTQSPSATNRNNPVVVTIKTRFDETTTSLSRGDALLTPNSRVLTLFDDRGNYYAPASQSGAPLTQALRPGDSYTTELVFNISTGAKPARLLINEGEWVTHFVIGHENSPLHKKTEFQL